MIRDTTPTQTTRSEKTTLAKAFCILSENTTLIILVIIIFSPARQDFIRVSGLVIKQ